MALGPGTRLGPYEVTAQIGVGGMGEVYRATDTNLKRQVAIKVLPEAVAADAERLARFQREAEVLAALNHPNIAGIYGLERIDAQTALVMELVEGPTLADRIAEGAIPVDEALPIAKQIAEALEAAHEQGIVHRDLKPANIKLRPDGAVKVLDFGLAKAVEPTVGASSSLSMSPTITTPAMTQAGLILGTAAYMSPEQARGKPVDRRADIWAFGCVLFEMLTGARAFEGEDVADTLGNVMKMEPNWERVPASVPSRVERVLRACLQKKATERLDSAQAVRLALDGAFETVVPAAGESVASRPAPRWRPALPFAATAFAMVGVLLAVGWAVWPSSPAAPVTRSTHLLPEGVSFRNLGRSALAIAPDASRFVYNSDTGLRLRERSLADRVIPGTEHRLANPFFSPDGLSVGFIDAETSQLRKIAVSGGASTPLTPRITNLFGASWETDGTILYGQHDGIWRVSENGGEPKHVIVTEPGEQADGPQLLPGREWVLFAVTPRPVRPGGTRPRSSRSRS
jgi:eukaryotic-like serine/threonine-protein kinase